MGRRVSSLLHKAEAKVDDYVVKPLENETSILVNDARGEVHFIESSIDNVGVVQTVTSQMDALINQAEETVSSIVPEPAKHTAQRIKATAKGGYHAVTDGLSSAAHTLESDVTSTARRAGSSIHSAVSDIVTPIEDVFGSAIDTVEGAGHALFNDVGDMVDDVEDTAENAVNAIKGLPDDVSNTWDWIEHKGQVIISDVEKPFRNAKDDIESGMKKALIAVGVLGLVIWKATEKQRPEIRRSVVSGVGALGKRALKAAPLLV